MLKIFNECLTAINKCFKKILEDGLLKVDEQLVSAITPWQETALTAALSSESLIEINALRLPVINVHGMPTDSVVLSVLYKKDNKTHRCAALLVCNSTTEWCSVYLLDLPFGKEAVDEDNNSIYMNYNGIASAAEITTAWTTAPSV